MSEVTPVPDNAPVLPPAPPRESLITTAVKFLENPKVRDSGIDEKKQFLLKKGLTEEEINIAVSRAGVTAAGPNIESSASTIVQPTPSGLPYHAESVSVWTRLREYSVAAIIIGGVIYGLYSLYKRFIEPIFLRSSEEQQKKLESVEEGVENIKNDLGQNMQEIRTTMHEMQEKLIAQNMKLNQLSADLDASKVGSGYSSVSNSSIGELKAEITSIKGLLLSRNQFPSQPNLKPVIPSWQLRPTSSSKSSENEESAEDVPDETEGEVNSTTNNVNLHGGKTNNVNGVMHVDGGVEVNGTSVNSNDD